MNFPPIPSVIQMNPNQEPEQVTHFLSMASSPTTASGTLPSYFLPWTLALPVIRLDLVALSRSPNSTYLKHVKAIIFDEFSSHTLCHTDGSQSGTRTSYAFSINGVITHHRFRNSASYFRLNYLPSIPASLIFLSFPLHINSSSFPIPSPPSK